MKTKAPTVTATGNLSRCTFKRKYLPDWSPRHRRGFHGERFDLYLDCILRTDDGREVHFKTPPSRMLVKGNTVLFRESKWDETFPADHPWLGVREDKKLCPKVQLGERVTIQGRVKSDTVLFFVKRVT